MDIDLNDLRDLVNVLHDHLHVVDICLPLPHDVLQHFVFLRDLHVLLVLPVHLLLLLLQALLILFGQIETAVELVLLNARVSALAGKRIADVAPCHRRILGLLLVDSLPQLLQPVVVVLL